MATTPTDPPARRRPWELAVIGAVVLGGAALLAMPDTTRGCTMIGGISTLSATLPADAPAHVATYEIELCQDGRCRTTATHAVQRSDDGIPVVQARLLPGIDLGDGWTTAPGTTATVVGTAPDGSQVLKHRQVFAFENFYPNGRECDADENFLHHVIEVPDSALRPA